VLLNNCAPKPKLIMIKKLWNKIKQPSIKSITRFWPTGSFCEAPYARRTLHRKNEHKLKRNCNIFISSVNIIELIDCKFWSKNIEYLNKLRQFNLEIIQ
jgi:hypothetical protein